MPPYMDRIWCNTSNTPLTTLNLDKVSVNTLCSADPSESKVSGPQYTSWGVFAFLWPTLRGPRRPSNEPTFWPKYFYETRLSHESSAPLIGFLAYLNEKFCHKDQKAVKYSYP